MLKQLLCELEKAGVTPDQLLSRCHSLGIADPASGQAALAGPDSMVLLGTAVELTGDHESAMLMIHAMAYPKRYCVTQ